MFKTENLVVFCLVGLFFNKLWQIIIFVKKSELIVHLQTDNFYLQYFGVVYKILWRVLWETSNDLVEIVAVLFNYIFISRQTVITCRPVMNRNPSKPDVSIGILYTGQAKCFCKPPPLTSDSLPFPDP